MLNLVYVSGKALVTQKANVRKAGEPAGCAGATHEYFSPDTVALSTIEKDVVFAVEGTVDLKKLHRTTLPKRKPGNLLLSNVVSWNRATDGEHHVTASNRTCFSVATAPISLPLLLLLYPSNQFAIFAGCRCLYRSSTNAQYHVIDLAWLQ